MPDRHEQPESRSRLRTPANCARCDASARRGGRIQRLIDRIERARERSLHPRARPVSLMMMPAVVRVP